jgi:hypothetical protein
MAELNFFASVLAEVTATKSFRGPRSTDVEGTLCIGAVDTPGPTSRLAA